MKVLVWICMMACLVITAPAFAQDGATDPLTGRWTGDWGPTPNDRNSVTVDLKWDGKALTGTVNPGPNAVPLQKSTFNAKTGTVHMEADARAYGGRTVHYLIDGKLQKNTMTGSWNHDNRKGDFKIMKN